MSSYRNLVLIALFFLVANPPRAHGAVTGGSLAQVQVAGILACGVPGTLSSLGSPPLPGVPVNITCNGGTVTLGQAITNTAGFLNATFDIADGLLFNSSTCVATVNLLGIVTCSVSSPTGILRTSLVLVSIVEEVVLFVTGLIL